MVLHTSVVLVLALGGCATSSLGDGSIDRALTVGEGYVSARNWQGAAEALAPLDRHPWTEGDPRRARALRLLGRVHRELGQTAQALVDLDRAGDDPAVVAEREALARDFRAGIQGTASATAHLVIHDRLPRPYVLSTLGLVLDGKSILWWQRSAGQAPPAALDLAVTPTAHVLRLEGAFDIDAQPVETVQITAEWVLACIGEGTCEATVDVVDRGGPLTPFGRGVVADLQVRERPGDVARSPQPLRAAVDRAR